MTQSIRQHSSKPGLAARQIVVSLVYKSGKKASFHICQANSHSGKPVMDVWP